MKFLTVNNLGPNHIVCSLDKIEGNILWSGHKFNIKEAVLPHVLQYYYDKLHSKFLFVDYNKWARLYNKQELQNSMHDCFFTEKDQMKGLKKSYESLLNLMSNEFGEFKKINFVVL